LDAAAKRATSFAKGLRDVLSPSLGLATLSGLTTSVNGLISRNVDAIKSAAHLADQLNITTQSIQAFRSAAEATGATTAEMDQALLSLDRTLAAVQSGDRVAANALTRLGLDARAVAALPVDRAFERIADALASSADPAIKAAGAYGLFGDKAQQLLPILTGGADAIDRAAKRADTLGLSFSRVDAAKVQNAALAMGRIQDVLDSSVRQTLIALAPYIEAAANQFEKMGGVGNAAANFIISGFKLVAYTIAQLRDWGRNLAIVFDTIRLGFVKLIQAGEAAGNYAGATWETGIFLITGEGLPTDKLLARAKATSAWEDTAREITKSIDKNLFAESNVGSVEDFFKKIEEGALKSAEAMKKLKSAEGSIAVVTKYSKALEGAKQTIADNQSPLQKFASRIEELHQQLDLGALGWETYAKAVASAFGDLEKANQLTEIRRPEALQRNTGGAASAVSAYEADLRYGFRRENPQERIKNVLEQSRDIQNRQLTLSERIAKGIDDLNLQELNF
jgi:hypothetical protein